MTSIDTSIDNFKRKEKQKTSEATIVRQAHHPERSRRTLKDEIMPNQAIVRQAHYPERSRRRVTKVLVTLLTSMTIGAIILMALGHNPPSAGPFSLWTYYRLDPVQKAISSRAAQSTDRWNRIEIYYSGTKAGNIEQLALLSGLAGPEDINFHFCLCNGRGGEDGQIQATEKWQRQWPLIPGRTWYGSSQTIRICVIADGKTTHLTDCQIKRIETLLDGLCRKFRIQPESIYYPSDWH